MYVEPITTWNKWKHKTALNGVCYSNGNAWQPITATTFPALPLPSRRHTTTKARRGDTRSGNLPGRTSSSLRYVHICRRQTASTIMKCCAVESLLEIWEVSCCWKLVCESRNRWLLIYRCFSVASNSLAVGIVCTGDGDGSRVWAPGAVS